MVTRPKSAKRSGVPITASAVTVNRFCSSGLQAIAYGAERIIAGGATAIVAGGTESMSLVPMGGNKIAPNPALVDSYPDVYLTTGLVAENHARESAISREEQDAFALRSHQRAVSAIDGGRFVDEIVALPLWGQTPDAGLRTSTATSAPFVEAMQPGSDPGRIPVRGQTPDGGLRTLAVDEGPRRDTSLEALAKLKPAFHVEGTVTAGHSVSDNH